MAEFFWLGLIFKMVAGAAVVLAASMIAERSGPFLGALVATLPVSAGPLYVFLAMEHGAAFIGGSAVGSLLAAIATAVFVVIYAFVGKDLHLVPSLLTCLGAWGLACFILDLGEWTLPTAFAASFGIYAACLPLIGWFGRAAPVRRGAPPWWELPMRAVITMAVVASVVLSGNLFGPRVAGFFAVLPVVFTSLVIVLHTSLGGPACAAVMVNGAPGMMGFTVAVAALGLLAEPFGAPIALSVGLSISVGWNLMLLAVQRLNAYRRR